MVIASMKRVKTHKHSRPSKRARFDSHSSVSRELKAVDVLEQAVTLQIAGAFVLLNGVEEGTDFYQRSGRRVRMKSLKLDGAYFSTGGSGEADYVRHIVFYDKQPNGAAPSVADVITAVNVVGTTSSTSMDGINLNNRDRFQILMDERVAIPESTAVATGEVAIIYGSEKMRWERYINLRDMKVQFLSSSGLIAGIATGSIYLLTLTLNGSPGYALNLSTRLRYYDD